MARTKKATRSRITRQPVSPKAGVYVAVPAPDARRASFEQAWVIAAGDYRFPVYWSGAGWSGNPRHAVLMVRREDARRVADNMALMGPEWDMPDDIRPEQAIKPSAADMVRQLATWRVGHERDSCFAG